MSNHLWYLSEETIALAFFDQKVSSEEKRKMVDNLNLDEPHLKLRSGRKVENQQNLLHSSLSDFVSKRTKGFFSRFGLSTEYLSLDPSEWEKDEKFQDNSSFCRNLFVVNDTAERGVKFMKDYNRILTNNEEEKQFLLQVVESYRNQYPSYKKSCLL